MIHLDSNAVDLILTDRWRPDDEIAMSAVAYAEAIRAAAIRPDMGFRILKADFVRSLKREAVISFDRDVAEIFHDLSLERSGERKVRDLMIAATAVSRDALLVTNDRLLSVLDGVRLPNHDPLKILFIE